MVWRPSMPDFGVDPTTISQMLIEVIDIDKVTHTVYRVKKREASVLKPRRFVPVHQ